MTLTEKWKKGELESGWYYVNFYSIDGAVMQEYLPTHNGFGYDEKNLVQEVLAPVPSYEEWKDTENRSLLTTEFSNEIDELNEENQHLRKWCEEFNALDVAKENQQLKELLHSLKCCLTSENIEPQIRIDKSLGKIDEVLK